MSTKPALAHLTLRIGLAFAFLYPPVSALFDPASWEGYFPHFVHALPIAPVVLLHAFGALEAVLAVWILSGWRIRLPSTLAALILISIVLLDASDFEILFRDVSLALLALALALWPSARAAKPPPASP